MTELPKNALPIFILIFASLGTTSTANADPLVHAELKLFEGEWKIVTAENGGEVQKSTDLVKFSNNKCTITHPKSKTVFENTFSIDPSKSPKRIIVTNTKTKEVWAGIYELKGDQLKCLFYGGKDAPVPTEFKTKKDGLETLYTYERIKTK